MQQVHVLVDLENNQPTLDDVRRLVPGLTDVWLFHSRQQANHLGSFAPLEDAQTAVKIARPGNNSLDFHLAFYLGYIAARNPEAKLVVVAIDGGYAPMIEHARTLGFDVERTPFHRTRAAAMVPPAAKTPAKKAARNTPAKTATASKTPTKQAPAKAVPAKKAAAKRAPAKKASPARAAAKVSAKKPNATPTAKKVASLASTPAAPQAGVAAPDQKTVTRIIESLRKMEKHRPARLVALRRHVKAMLRQGATEAAINAAVAALRATGVIKIVGAAVKYAIPKAAKN